MPKVKITEETYNKLKVLGHCLHSEEGWELYDPDPLAIPAGLKRPLSLREQIQRVLRTEVSAQAVMQGLESFEESEDFDVEDEFDSAEIRSVYEMKEEFPLEIGVEKGSDYGSGDRVARSAKEEEEGKKVNSDLAEGSAASERGSESDEVGRK